MNDLTQNVDTNVAAGFGKEWSTFRQSEGEFSTVDREAIFQSYFHIFPWNELPPDAVGIDVGCGSGRWSVMVAPKVGHLHLLDASGDALEVARQNLTGAANVSFHLASVGNIPLEDNSLDFAFSLGVLHHKRGLLETPASYLDVLFWLFTSSIGQAASGVTINRASV
jgi:SAM-dependent methyltransferase